MLCRISIFEGRLLVMMELTTAYFEDSPPGLIDFIPDFQILHQCLDLSGTGPPHIAEFVRIDRNSRTSQA